MAEQGTPQIEIKGGGTKGQKGELAVLLEYFLMQHGYYVERGPVYQKGLTDLERAKILQKIIHLKGKLQEAKSTKLEVIL